MKPIRAAITLFKGGILSKKDLKPAHPGEVEPDVQTRNRKPLKRPVDFGAQWELRLGPENVFRVFYKIDHENLKVNILAIGEKRGARLIIGGEEVRL